jgi:hypothetical protein
MAEYIDKKKKKEGEGLTSAAGAVMVERLQQQQNNDKISPSNSQSHARTQLSQRCAPSFLHPSQDLHIVDDDEQG